MFSCVKFDKWHTPEHLAEVDKIVPMWNTPEQDKAGDIDY